MNQLGNLIVISGPSGTGKGTICKELLNIYHNFAYSISATTRAPREGEINGVNYWFTTKEEFKQMIAQEELLEWAEVYGNYYGTPLKRIKDMLNSGKDVILEIDPQGALQVKKKFSEAVLVYILPPSLEELAKRIHNRATDSEESIICRLNAATEEIRYATQYNYIVVNDIVATATEKIAAIIKAEKCNVLRNQELLNQMIGK